eukprot:CAMPEP_0184869512 /NCGR_PEP_ID=MMETSP0580-20130426/34405_1 /TAXON_ID=1118495 /ORGANISM="Dactyliosolen fragilissimus" /LENGTH=525 /DNA_ID=CAMNT_0027371045 /DNA_START=296 /DNA_END=1874 /DNA_ORIENTATION=+
MVAIGEDINGDSGDDSPFIVSISGNGNVIAYGAVNGFRSQRGHVRVFFLDESTGTWVQIGEDIQGEMNKDRLGAYVSLSSDGESLAVGIPFIDDEGITNRGGVRIYRVLPGVLAPHGSIILGETGNEFAGSTVSIAPHGLGMVAIGYPGYSSNGLNNRGRVRIFLFSLIKFDWVQHGSTIFGEAGDDRLGRVSLSTDGTTVAIGTPSHRNNRGLVRVYRFSNKLNDWEQMGQGIHGFNNGDNFGLSISISTDGMAVAIGASNSDQNGISSGHVALYNFDNIKNKWVQVGPDINGEAPGDKAGLAVSLSSNGRVIATGTYLNDGNGMEDSGHVRVFTFEHIFQCKDNSQKDNFFCRCRCDENYISYETGNKYLAGDDDFCVTMPSSMPSKSPSVSFRPSISPSLLPSISPSYAPSTSPSLSPSTIPTYAPSASPSLSPSSNPSYAPSSSPSHSPSTNPSYTPSVSPSHSPSSSPSSIPSVMSSVSPSSRPSLRRKGKKSKNNPVPKKSKKQSKDFTKNPKGKRIYL